MVYDQQLFILGQFYIKKGNYLPARDIFSKLLTQNPSSFQVSFFLGKVEYKLSKFTEAITHFEHSRRLNPFNKSTLLLLSRCYSAINEHKMALECMVDTFLLSKETSDTRIDNYKKKIRKLAKKVSHDMDDRARNLLIKERLQYFKQELQKLEQRLVTTEKPTSTPEVFLEMAEETQAAMEDPEFNEPQPVTPHYEPTQETDSELDHSLVAVIVEHIEQENRIEDSEEEFVGMEDPPEDAPNLAAAEFPKSNVDFGRHILFKSLSAAHQEKIQKFTSIQTYAPNDVIHTPLEPIYGFSCVMDGKVRIYHQNESLMELETGSIIDEAELCNGVKYFFETRAVEPTTILMVNKAALLTLCKRQHELAVHFLWHFYKSLSLKINSIFESVIYKNPSNDIIWSLDRLQEITQQRTLNELELEYLSHKLTKRIQKKGDFIFKNHAPADTFYILLEGEIELDHPYSKDVIEIKNGEFFSEIGLISNSFEHSMNAKVVSEHAILLQINRPELSKLHDPNNRDQYRMMEILWNIYSRKYFEFLNFYFHLIKG
jgi:CRP-like cAMP-binding protein